MTARLAIRLTTAAVAAACLAPAIALAGDESGRRPVYHFTPERNFINDPNGLVFLAGEYHLFYQHNPEGDRWGHMSWGHAVSPDLVRWRHLPIALREESGIMIFSGSAVVDAANRSGLGTRDIPPMVAVYTGDGRGKQTQDLASSVDRGRTWTKFAGNPVIDLNSNAFRDPKVFWHEPTRRWVMATVLAEERKVRLFSSDDLKAWKPLSDFGPAGSTKGVWECPELFEVPLLLSKTAALSNTAHETRWVLKVDVNDGAPHGGSGGQYFVGAFDGERFVPEGDTSEPLWYDFGKDFYAAQCWNDAPDGLPVWIAWMNNWQYANDIPTAPWRGAMTVPRTLSLYGIDGRLRLLQEPVESLRSLRRGVHEVRDLPIPEGDTPLDEQGVKGVALEIIATLEPGDADEVGLKVRRGDGEETVIGIEIHGQNVYVDRTRSGATGFSPHFSGRHTARLHGDMIRPGQGIRLQILVDATSVEVFAGEGVAVITDQIFPKPSSQGVSLFARGGQALLRSLEAWELRP